MGGFKKIGGKTSLCYVYKLSKVSHSWEAIGHISLARHSTIAISAADKVIATRGVNDKEQYTNAVWIGACEP